MFIYTDFRHSQYFKNLKYNKNLTLVNKINRNNDLYLFFSMKNFSTTDPKTDITLNNILMQTKEQKDLKYEDACFYFEKEWKKLEEDKFKKHQVYMSKDLSDHQKKECDIIIERILKFNAFEAKYFKIIFKEYLENNTGILPHRPNVFDKRNKFGVELSKPEHNPNYKTTQEILSVLMPFISSGYFSGGGAAAPAGSSEIKKTEEPKKEKEPEKVVVYFYY